MATRAELAQQERDREQAIHDACATLATYENGGLVLSALVESIDAEGVRIAAARRKGWQSEIKAHVTASEIVRQWRDRVTAYVPPAPPTPVEPREPTVTRDAQGIGIDNRAKNGEDLDARLRAAFGPAAAPVRHIRTMLEHTGDDSSDPSTYGPLCGEPGGSFTHPGGSNCPSCHAHYAEQHDGRPYDGPGHVDVPALLADGPVTPAVARQLRERREREVGADPSAPALGIPARTVTEITPPTLADLGIVLNDPGKAEPVRLTLGQISERGRARNRGADHRSYSQISAFEECGARYALDVDDRPAWWNVGGTAFHNAGMAIAQAYVATADPDLAIGDPGALWSAEFDKEIARVTDASGTDPERWRAAGKGTEHYDWWRVEGAEMTGRYQSWFEARYAEGWRVATDHSGRSMVEYETSFWVPAPGQLSSGVKVDNVIDLVLERGMPGVHEYLIVDLKSGAKAPTSNLQLAFYHWALAAALPPPQAIRGCYYLARRAETTAPADLGAAYPWPDMAQRIIVMDQQERAGIYIPRPNMFCRACPAARICPEGPR